MVRVRVRCDGKLDRVRQPAPALVPRSFTKNRDGSFRLRVQRASMTSRFRGVCWHKRDKKWEVIIVNGKLKSVGYFADEIEAAHAYDAYVIVNGIATPRNFPNKAEDAVLAEAERGRAAKKRKTAAGKSSRFRGVSWHKATKKWQVHIRVDGKSKHVGTFADDVEAAQAYDAYATKNDLKPHNAVLLRETLATREATSSPHT